MQRSRLIILFAKYPERGKVKTRLAARLGDEHAVRLYEYFVLDLITTLKAGPWAFKIAFSPAEAAERFTGWLGKELTYVPQSGSDLGERMSNAFLSAFREGFQDVVLIGSDVPDLDGEIIEQAFAQLEHYDAVIGPSIDGGYYLVGFTAGTFLPDIFEGIRWSSETVLKDTLALFSENGSTVSLLPRKRDIDTFEDLKEFYAESKIDADGCPKTLSLLKTLPHLTKSPAFRGPRFTFSVIIPVMHEAECINAAIDFLRAIGTGETCEIIVVDGSPARDTIDAVIDPHVVKTASCRGRARQMNAGAALAKGDILVFLHADTKLPAGAFEAMHRVLEEGRYAGGAFALTFDSDKTILRCIARAATMRTRFTRIPYGDQAIFLKRDFFALVGGYADIPLMEDIELMRRVRAHNSEIALLSDPVTTSARKWLKDGILYTSARNIVLRLLYAAGISPHRLVSFYYKNYKK